MKQENTDSRVEVTAQGRLLIVKTFGACPEQFRGKKRGNVEGFTKSSRMRLMQLLAKIETPESKGYRFKVSFLTLTTRKIHHPKEFKGFLSRFYKRLGRKFPMMAVVWRLEYQKRGAPHAHLILYNAPWLDKLWIQKSWGEIVGQDAPFTRIERIRSYRHLMRYASKYAAKVQTCGFNYASYLTEGGKICSGQEVSPGRVWGVVNRKALPLAEKTKATIPNDGSWWMIRRYCGTFYPFLDVDDEYGFTIFTKDPYHALAHILRLSESFSSIAYC